MVSGCGIYTPDLCFSFGCLFPLCYELTPFLGELGIPKSKLLRVDLEGQVMNSRSLWFILDCLCFFSTEWGMKMASSFLDLYLEYMGCKCGLNCQCEPHTERQKQYNLILFCLFASTPSVLNYCPFSLF